jgi:carboxyl-terminal processing protease
MQENERKSGLGAGILIGVLATVIVVLIVFSAGVWGGIFTINGGSLMKSGSGSTVDSEEFSDKATAKIERVMKIMDAYYLEDLDEDAMIDGMLEGMLAAVDDPYTGYYDEESYSTLLESSEGVYYGIGAVVSQNVETGEVYIVNPYEDGPAYEAGMRPGDIVYKVRDTDVTGMDLNEVVAMIRGEEGTTVDVTVLHEGENEYSTITIERRKIENHTVEYEMLEDGIGYIQISEFDDVTTEQFKKGMDELTAQGMQKVIVDLRDNPGGSLSTVIDVLDTVLPKGIYTYLVDKYGNRQNYRGENNAKYDCPMVVLVNGNSASASELFTGAVHDYDRATIVGTTTFGKGIVQQVFSLGDGTGMKVTMAKYYTPNGVCIHKTGITPDYEVELDEGEYASTVAHEDDEQLLKAIELLK